MNKEKFTAHLQSIYAAFGKAFPSNPVALSIWKRVQDLPDGFMEYAVGRFENSTSFPTNPGFELRRVLWPEYLDKNPHLRARESMHGCRQCSPDTPGFFWAYETNGKRYSLKCSCNGRKDFEHVQAWTHAMALDSGLYLHDPTAPEVPEYLPPAARAAIGHTEQARPDHVRELEHAETARW